MASPAGPDRLREELARRSIALDRELGRGGMSVVYLARDLRHDRLLAVKVLLPGVPAGAERFLREIMLVSPLAHPHIVPFYDSGAVDGAPFFLMPYIEGESLRERLNREHRLDIDQAVQIAGEVAEALEFAHARGILHRDIKPENILLQAGHALVADFGVARALSEAAAEGAPEGRVTGQGLIVGTAEYVSPEQASGDRDLDGRSDIYSLGCVLYEMLAGTPPFTGDTPRAVMARRFRESPRPLLELRPEIPAALAATVDRALAADPADRFPSVTSFLAALRSPPTNRSAIQRPRLRSIAHRLRLRALPGWPGALLLVAGLVGVALFGTGHPSLDPHRIVVARMSNETGDTNLAYLGELASDRLSASLAGDPRVHVVASATIIPSRLTTGLEVDSLDDPARLHRLAEETKAGTLISGSYFKANSQIAFQAEITDANDGTVLAAVGPVAAPIDSAEAAVDSLGRSVVAAVRRVKSHG